MIYTNIINLLFSTFFDVTKKLNLLFEKLNSCDFKSDKQVKKKNIFKVKIKRCQVK